MAGSTRKRPGTSSGKRATASTKRRAYAPRLPLEERREQLLDATLALIVREGYEGATMEGVARAAGVTKPVVYHAFGDREGLLRTLLQREERRALGALAEAMPQLPVESDPDALMVEGFTAFLRAVARHPDAWRLILMPAYATPEVVRRHVEEGRSAALERLQQLLVWGVGQRGGPANLDVEFAAHAILATGEHAARLTLTDPQRFPPERAGAYFAGLLAGLARGRA